MFTSNLGEQYRTPLTSRLHQARDSKERSQMTTMHRSWMDKLLTLQQSSSLCVILAEDWRQKALETSKQWRWLQYGPGRASAGKIPSVCWALWVRKRQLDHVLNCWKFHLSWKSVGSLVTAKTMKNVSLSLYSLTALGIPLNFFNFQSGPSYEQQHLSFWYTHV